MTDSENLIQKVHDRLREEREKVTKLEATIKQDSMKKLLQRASDSLDDVEDFFLRSAENEKRTPDALRRWLSNTDLVFHIAGLHRKVVEDAVAAYGPDVVAIYPR